MEPTLLDGDLFGGGEKVPTPQFENSLPDRQPETPPLTLDNTQPQELAGDTQVEAASVKGGPQDAEPTGEDDAAEDGSAPTLPPKKLSPAAVNKRMYRICKPRADGTYKVPKEVVEEYHDLAKRDRVMALFEKSGYHPDRCRGLNVPGWSKPIFV